MGSQRLPALKRHNQCKQVTPERFFVPGFSIRELAEGDEFAATLFDDHPAGRR